MQTYWFTLGVVLLMALTGRAAAIRWRQTLAFRKLAKDYHLHYSPEDFIDLHDRYYPLTIIRQGHNRHISNVLHGVHDEGLVSLFSYRFDCGFAGNQTGYRLWIATVETDVFYPEWLAIPATTVIQPFQSIRSTTKVCSDFTIISDNMESMDSTTRAGLEVILSRIMPQTCVEIRRNLVAMSTPYDGSSTLPGRLLTATIEVARLLRPGRSR